MKVAVTYVMPVVQSHIYEPLAKRFAQSYMAHPPGESDHSLHVLVNGGPISDRQRKLFDPVPFQFHQHNNSGKDIGAFQMAADTIPCDLLVCLGANIHFRRAGWLDRIVRAYEDNGPGLYGGWAFHQPLWHIRTTAFWITPQIFKSYPWVVSDQNRYEWEHGQGSITRWTLDHGFGCYMVTWGGVFDPQNWHHVENNDCLMLDQFCDRQGFT